MKNKSLTFKNFIIVFLCLLSFFVATFSPAIVPTFAEKTVKTSVLEDLSKDSSFNSADYPIISDTTDEAFGAIKVIQIAESENDELFIYTYEPSATVIDLEVTQIAMWNNFSSNGKDFTPVLYDLELVSQSIVFSKYLVKNYTIEDKAERYYNISAIYRKFNSILDKDTSSNGFETSEKAISVGQQWFVCWYNDVLAYEMNTFETVDISVKHSGFLSFKNGLTFGSLLGLLQRGHLHYLAFDVENYIVEHIYDADVSFKKRSYTTVTLLSSSSSYGEWSSETVFLSDVDTVTFDGQGLFSKDYIWNRISSSSTFVSNMEKQNVTLVESSKNEILSSQWVFAFTETEYSFVVDSLSGAMTEYGEEISDVTVLRLHFLDTNNKFYNLGVVSDKVTPDNVPDNVVSDGCPDFDFSKILAILALIVLAWVLIQTGLMKYLVDFIIWLVKLPVRFIKWIASKIKQSKAKKLKKQKKKAPKRKK